MPVPGERPSVPCPCHSARESQAPAELRGGTGVGVGRGVVRGRIRSPGCTISPGEGLAFRLGAVKAHEDAAGSGLFDIRPLWGSHHFW